MLRLMQLVVMLWMVCSAGAAESTSFEQAGVRLEVAVTAQDDGSGLLEAVFTPIEPTKGSPWHLYSKDLPKEGIDFIGRPTLIEIDPGQGVTALAPLEADRETHDLVMLGMMVPVYPPGPVTLRQRIGLPAGDGTAVAVTMRAFYMLCNDSSCLRPVQDQAIEVLVPTRVGSAAEPSQDDPTPGAAVAASGSEASQPVAHDTPAALATETAADESPDLLGPWLRALLVAAAGSVALWALGLVVQRAQPQATRAWQFLLAAAGLSVALVLVAGYAPRVSGENGIQWREARDVAHVEQLISEAHGAGTAVVLDFTGPSCLNCQVMAKNVFVLPEVTAAWNSAVPIEINTDPPHDDLAAWQQDKFQTQNRPLYVRIEPDGSEQRWNRMVDPGDPEAVTALIGFLEGRGGDGDVVAGILTDGWGGFVLLALAGGLFTLVMPCTYPMIPFTITFFAKQADAGRRLVPLAAFYSLGIIGFFVGIGVVVAGVLGASVATVAGHPLTNLAIAALFLAFGLSLLGVFLLRLPAGLESRIGGGRGGYLGALAMGLTFAVTAFTCTAPFAGFVLGSAASQGSWSAAVIGMAIYASVIAVPFFFLALAPNIMQRLPKAGAWMSEFKVVGGLVEIGAAVKFLAIADFSYGWGLVTRTPSLAVWSALSALCALYLIGWIRSADDAPVARVALVRAVAVAAFAVFAIWLAGGLFGQHLGMFESFFPGDVSPGS